MSDGLKRARAPFRVRNALTGFGLAAFAVGVWAYSIGAVKQDVFDDVDEEARALSRAGLKGTDVQEAEKQIVAATTDITTAGLKSLPPTDSPSFSANPSAPTSVGLLPKLLGDRFNHISDPSTKTLVWGAPPLDNIGKMGDRRS